MPPDVINVHHTWGSLDPSKTPISKADWGVFIQPRRQFLCVHCNRSVRSYAKCCGWCDTGLSWSGGRRNIRVNGFIP